MTNCRRPGSSSLSMATSLADAHHSLRSRRGPRRLAPARLPPLASLAAGPSAARLGRVKHSRLDAKVHESQNLLAQVLGQLRVEFDLPVEFPPAVMVEARQAVAGQALPEADLTSLPFVT